MTHLNDSPPCRPEQDIPTSDPHDALRFCKALKSALAGTGTPPIADQPPARPELSVVVPIYNEEANLEALTERLTAALDGLAGRHEIVLVDDGSSETCKEMLSETAREHDRVIVVELSRNFGHQVAISAGMDFAQGEAVVVMDGDLQDPPELIPDLLTRLKEGYDVVYAIRRNRKEDWFKRTAYKLFYRMLSRASTVDVPLDAGDFCIMTRRVSDILASMPERNRFVRGIRSWIGLRQTGLPYDRDARHAGRPKYSLLRLIILALDGFVSLSKVPLRIASVLGFTVSLLSLVMACVYIAKKLTSGLSPPGFATLITAILFFAGVQLITIGFVGEYVGRISDEVKKRPLYIVRRVTGRDADV